MITWRVIPSPLCPGLFAVARGGPFIPNTVEIDSITDERHAERIARTLTKEYARKQARLAAQPASIYDRRLPSGFYTNQDAS